MLVQGESRKLLGVEGILQTGLGIDADDWCRKTAVVTDSQILPGPLAELCFPDQLSDFVLKPLQVHSQPCNRTVTHDA